MSDEKKVITLDGIILDMQLKNIISMNICEMELKSFLNTFMTELYKYMREYDEIDFGNIGEYISSIKRTPTINELEDKIANSDVIFSNKEKIDNFKLYITKKKNTYKDLL